MSSGGGHPVMAATAHPTYCDCVPMACMPHTYLCEVHGAFVLSRSVIAYVAVLLMLQKSDREKPPSGETNQDAPTQTPCNSLAYGLTVPWSPEGAIGGGETLGSRRGCARAHTHPHAHLLLELHVGHIIKGHRSARKPGPKGPPSHPSTPAVTSSPTLRATRHIFIGFSATSSSCSQRR